MFYLKWTLANGLAYALGVPAVMRAIDILGRLDTRLFHLVQDPTFNHATIWFLWLGIIIIGLLLGVIIAPIQQIVLLSEFQSDKSWIVYTILAHGIGLPLALGLGFPFMYLGNGPVAFLIMGVMMAGITGTFQWFILRKSFSLAGIWIVASCLGMGFGMALGFYLIENVRILASPDATHLIVLGAVSGLSYGSITSAALVFIQR
jgi:hypothetical protein